MMNPIHDIGYIDFGDHREDIINFKRVGTEERIYTIITSEGFYVYDADEYDTTEDPYKLYKQVVTGGSFPHTIKSQLHVCEYKSVVLYR